MMPTLSSLRQGDSPVVTDCAQPHDISAFVQHYTGAEFVFASPHATLFAADMVPLPTDDTLTTGERVARALHEARAGLDERTGPHTCMDARDQACPMVVGAVPFDATAPAALFLARNLTRGAALARAHAPPGHASGLSVVDVPARAANHGMRIAREHPWPAPVVYEAAVTDALARFEAGSLGKVVLSRTLALQFDAPLGLSALMQRLLEKNVHGYTYAVPVPDTTGSSPDRVFLGATPELLVRRVGRRVSLNPLAGSAARRLDRAEDQAVASALMASTKDLQEHAIVIDAIAQILRPLCRSLDVPARPSLTATDALWHLSTTIEGELADPSVTALDLAFALHPTPAVCGYPVAAAQSAIAELEPFDRGLFAGFVGWIDANGDGEWAVSLRCALCGPNEATLYAGAGIVPGSVPERETAETQTKFRTMLSALGLGGAIAAN